MSNKLTDTLNYILVSTGTAGIATVTFWQNIDLGLSILLKFVSLATFVCYILINHDDIEKGYYKFRDRIKNYFKK